MSEKDQGPLDVNQIKDYWLTEAEEALHVAEHLIEKADYSYALFFGHVAVEKLLKAIYVVRHDKHAPPIHNLLRLSNITGLELDEGKTESLIKITAFNIEARYPDVRRAFRKRCTAEFTGHQMEMVKEVFQWLKSLLP